MKMNATKVKKHVRKLKHASEQELKELQGSYTRLMADVRRMDEPLLFLLMVVGLAIVLLFDWGIIDLIGLLILVYPLYLFARQDGHEEGYYEGYYEKMCDGGNEVPAPAHNRSSRV